MPTDLARHVLLLFVDGLGLGSDDAHINPLADERLRVLHRTRSMPHPFRADAHTLYVATDPTLGVAGLPQSATGQTTLYTGVNAARLMGGHRSGVPLTTLRRVLTEHSIMRACAEHSIAATFANAYAPRFFALKPPYDKYKLSASSWAHLASGLRFRDFDDLARGEAVFQDITCAMIREHGGDVPLLSPEQAGESLARVVRAHQFTLFEYFQTDHAGHGQDMAVAKARVDELDRFVRATLDALSPEDTAVVLMSDHGNVEDLSTKTHTLNPTLTLLWGRAAEVGADAFARLDEVNATLRTMLGLPALVVD